jgi:hypothetical protein
LVRRRIDRCAVDAGLAHAFAAWLLPGLHMQSKIPQRNMPAMRVDA